MNELQVKTIELEPAKVVFNHEEIEKDLEKNLKKYSGLTFTENDATECKSTIAELRKGKKAVDQYRLKIKKELTVPVTEFENKCKALNSKFDEVINPLVSQHVQFEEKREEEKRQKVQEIIAQLIEEFDLLEKYAVDLVIADSYLTKSKSIKSITEELETNAEHLKMKQDKEASDKQSIINQVKLSNTENDLNLSESSYLSLLDFKDVNEITEQIVSDVDRELEKKTQEEKRKQEQLERESQELIMQVPSEPTEPVDAETMPDPFADVIPVETNEPSVFEVYKATGTESQLKALETFMSENGINWEVIDDE